jgi:hypothetical protein
VSATEFQPHLITPMRKAANSLDPIANRPGEFGAWIRALKPGRPPAVACTRQNGDGGEGQRTSTGAGAEASLRGHLKAESGEQTGSQSYIPPDPKDDKALHPEERGLLGSSGATLSLMLETAMALVRACARQPCEPVHFCVLIWTGSRRACALFTLLNVWRSMSPIYNTRAFPSGESICDGRNPIAGSAEFHMLLDVDEFLCDARRRSAADTFRSDAIEQASLHIVSGIEIA